MRACSQSGVRLRSQDHQRSKGEVQKKRCCQVSFADKPAPSQSANPEMPSDEEGSEGRDSDLGELPELKPAVASFLWGSPETSSNEGKEMPPEPTVLDFVEWVHWKAERCDTPIWWMELSTVPGEDNTRKLARQVRASFKLPQQLQELDAERATLQAPPAPPCLHRQRFMPQADSIFASWDIREVPREKVVTYARALQYWVELNDLPTGGKPCLLAESVLELREEVKWYLTFTDEEVFQGVAIPEVEEEESLTTSSPTDIPKIPPVLELQPKERTPKFVGWEKCYTLPGQWLLPGWPPQPTQTLRPRGRSHQLSWMTPVRSPICIPKAPSQPEPSPPARTLALVRPPTPPQGFVGVKACLKMLELVEIDQEVPVGMLSIGLVMTLGISSISSSCIVKDDATV